MGKTTSCKKTRESPVSFSSLIGQKKIFSGQSEAGNSNASGTGSVRVSAQGLVSILQKTFTTNILSTRLTAPGSPRMVSRPRDKETKGSGDENKSGSAGKFPQYVKCDDYLSTRCGRYSPFFKNTWFVCFAIKDSC